MTANRTLDPAALEQQARAVEEDHGRTWVPSGGPMVFCWACDQEDPCPARQLATLALAAATALRGRDVVREAARALIDAEDAAIAFRTTTAPSVFTPQWELYAAESRGNAVRLTDGMTALRDALRATDAGEEAT